MINIQNYFEKVFGVKINQEAMYAVDGKTLGKMLSMAGSNPNFNSSEVQKVFEKAKEIGNG